MRNAPASAADLFQQIRLNRSFLCVGLDPDIHRLPAGLAADADGVRTFLLTIIEHTAPYAVAYKPNFAFFENLGPAGMAVLREVTAAIPDDRLIIGDAKRGDIGNTADQYARAVFQQFGCHAVTVSPYMGLDTLAPFLGHQDRWTVVLALTSNPGSQDFQRLQLADGGQLWERVMASCASVGNPDQMMFVVGATHPGDFKRVRELAPHHFLLVPGFGAQQGSLEAVAEAGMNAQCGLLANVSRGILYASAGADFGEAAAAGARDYQAQMEAILRERHLI